MTLDGLSVQILSAVFSCGVDLRAIWLQQLLVGVKMPLKPNRLGEFASSVSLDCLIQG